MIPIILQAATVIVLLSITLFHAGCSSKPKLAPPPMIVEHLAVTHHVGGTHERTLIHEGVWYQTFGTSLIIVDPATLMVAYEVSFGKAGTVGPATDMAILGDRMYVVIEDDAVVEVSLAQPRLPGIIRTIEAEALAVRPRRLSVIDGVPYASGPGGVVRLSDGQHIHTSADDVGRLVNAGGTLVAPIDRRIYAIPGGDYLGSATEVIALAGVNLTEVAAGAPLAFGRQGDQGAGIGLMTADFREVAGAAARAAVPGVLRRLRIFDGGLWAVTDRGVFAYSIAGDSLTETMRIDVAGARDVDRIDGNHLAIAGSFGRAKYRINADDRGPGNTFVRVERAPSRLTHSVRDPQHVLAGSDEGAWMYLIGARAELMNRSLETAPAPPRAAAALGATAKLSDDGRSVAISAGGSQWTHVEPHDAVVHTVVAIDGAFWLGHDRGITILNPEGIEHQASGTGAFPQVPSASIAELRLPGPVRYLHPLLVGGGAAYVSEFGGFGVARYVREAIPVHE